MLHRIISLLTDFGSRDAFVGIMKGVILGINPAAQLVDLSHEVPAQDVLAGALILRSAVAFFPPDTIHLAVVDPGVGSSRRGVLIETQHGCFIGPDNGLLSLAVSAEMMTRTIHLNNPVYFLSPCSSTFHGRDVFAPVAAHLSLGTAVEQFGPEMSTIERLTLPKVEHEERRLVGSVIYIDHFGNLVTNITEPDLLPFPRERLCVSIGAVRILGIIPSYAAVIVGTPAALINSWGLLEIAVRNGAAAQQLGVHRGCPVSVTLLQQ